MTATPEGLFEVFCFYKLCRAEHKALVQCRLVALSFKNQNKKISNVIVKSQWPPSVPPASLDSHTACQHNAILIPNDVALRGL